MPIESDTAVARRKKYIAKKRTYKKKGTKPCSSKGTAAWNPREKEAKIG